MTESTNNSYKAIDVVFNQNISQYEYPQSTNIPEKWKNERR